MNSTLLWIILGGVMMSAIALVGSLTLILKEKTLQRMILPLVALSAGSLLGGAFFHMLPSSNTEMGNSFTVYLWTVAGFLVFFCLEQFLQWHHSHSAGVEEKQPITYLILIADGLHNFIGGMGVAGSFIINPKVGIISWIAAAAHEIPQELGDFGVLINGGWSKKKALLFNFISALTFPVGALIAYFLSFHVNVTFLIPFAAGNFIYIAASDLIPEIKKKTDFKSSLIHSFFFILGLGILLIVRIIFE